MQKRFTMFYAFTWDYDLQHLMIDRWYFFFFFLNTWVKVFNQKRVHGIKRLWMLVHKSLILFNTFEYVLYFYVMRAGSEVECSVNRETHTIMYFLLFAFYIIPVTNHMHTLKDSSTVWIKAIIYTLLLGRQSACCRHKGAVALHVTWIEDTCLFLQSSPQQQMMRIFPVALTLRTSSLQHRAIDSPLF